MAQVYNEHAIQMQTLKTQVFYFWLTFNIEQLSGRRKLVIHGYYLVSNGNAWGLDVYIHPATKASQRHL